MIITVHKWIIDDRTRQRKPTPHAGTFDEWCVYYMYAYTFYSFFLARLVRYLLRWSCAHSFRSNTRACTSTKPAPFHISSWLLLFFDTYIYIYNTRETAHSVWIEYFIRKFRERTHALKYNTFCLAPRTAAAKDIHLDVLYDIKYTCNMFCEKIPRK